MESPTGWKEREKQSGGISEWISVRNCREHNLKNISLRIPLGRLTLICGVSGSGKSTLAHDVCFAEGRRRYMESFSAYARLFQARIKRPDADGIDNMPVAFSLEQVFLSQNPRSTVATLSDLYSPIRLLFARFTRWEDGGRPTRSHLSYNHPLGACAECQGLGRVYRLDLEKIVRDERRSLREGALRLSTPTGYIIYSQVTIDVLDQICRAHGFTVDIPWRELSDEQKNVVLYGSDRIEVPFGKHPLESRLKWSGITAKPRELGYYRGIMPIMEEILSRDPNPNILRWCRQDVCPVCLGLRVNKNVHLLEYRNTEFREVLQFTVSELADWVGGLMKAGSLSEPEEQLLQEIALHSRLISDLRLGHLSLMRPVPSLSAGEVQGIRLASLLKNPISDMAYILDEPASALHPLERRTVYQHVRSLLGHGCTVLLVSHDRSALDFADWVVEVGPEGGENGGRLLFCGEVQQFRKGLAENPDKTPSQQAWSIPFPPPPARDRIAETELLKTGAGRLTVISGRTGSGKSSMLQKLSEISGSTTEDNLGIQRVVIVDQQPLGRNSRSNPATYTGLFDAIRSLYAKLDQAKEAGLSASSFSFNSEAGACPDCQGTGTTEITLHFLAPLEQVCETCRGHRYRSEVLEVKYRGLSIDQVLNLTVNQALTVFQEEKRIHSTLRLLSWLGLGYLTLGQPSSTLSGGEAQRVRLASFIAPGRRDRSLYLLDEPCLGLHELDIPCLLEAMRMLAGQGATVVVAENNPLFINGCDRLLELASTEKHKDAGLPQPIRPDEGGEWIRMEGVRTRNLKGVSVSIPKKKLTVVSGPSGSGKSSLLQETLYKACQRRFAEHLSPYLRDRLALNGHGEYLAITPFMAALALRCHDGETSPRSTVGTLSGINDTLRVLFSRLGRTASGTHGPDFRAAHFSFNHPDGACSRCSGMGKVTTTDADLLIADADRSVLEGAFTLEKGFDHFFDPHGRRMAELRGAAEALNIDLSLPWSRLKEESKEMILKGREGEFEVNWNFSRGKRKGEHRYRSPWPGFNRLIFDAYQQKKDHKKLRIDFDAVVRVSECPSCRGLRLKEDALAVQLGRLSLEEVLTMPLEQLSETVDGFEDHFFAGRISAEESAVCREMMPGLKRQLEQIAALGLGYLCLSRDSNSLSFGELQRLRLASTLSNQVNHCLFLLDEVSRGLHPLDLGKLIQVLGELRQRGNTVALIEHHPLLHQEADWMIRLGPGGGQRGGEVCSMGPVSPAKATIAAVSPVNRSKNDEDHISIRAASIHNLNHLDLDIPGKGITVLCGVSGSGKSTLMREVIEKSALSGSAVHCRSIEGLDRYSTVHALHQQGEGIRGEERLIDFLALRKGVWRHFGTPPTSPCPHCQGTGETVTDLDYMGSFSKECRYCLGTGYDNALLPGGRATGSLIEVLSGDIEALPPGLVSSAGLAGAAAVLGEFSLGYLSLNRKMGTLSAGERQRLKMARILLQLGENRSLLLLDEPDGGLSMEECGKLVDTLRRHMNGRHSVLVISHHPLFLSLADWLIDLGPGAGEDGGRVTAQGTPADLALGDWPASRTAAFLRQHLSR